MWKGEEIIEISGNDRYVKKNERIWLGDENDLRYLKSVFEM